MEGLDWWQCGSSWGATHSCGPGRSVLPLVPANALALLLLKPSSDGRIEALLPFSVNFVPNTKWVCLGPGLNILFCHFYACMCVCVEHVCMCVITHV